MSTVYCVHLKGDEVPIRTHASDSVEVAGWLILVDEDGEEAVRFLIDDIQSWWTE